MKIIVIGVIVFLIFYPVISFGQNDVFMTPWIQTLGIWFFDEKISNEEFDIAIEYLIKKKLIIIPEYGLNELELPDWLINNSSWMATRIITNSDFNLDYLSKDIIPCDNCKINLNTHGFRGPEIKSEKDENVYRIFAVGGSTTHGASLVNDNETWPALLQEMVKTIDYKDRIEIINAGMMAFHTEKELQLISHQIVFLEPDMIIMYGGWNDSLHLSLEETIHNWKTVCKLGNERGFKTVILVEPILGSGNRVLTEHEMKKFNVENIQSLKIIEKYSENFDLLEEDCTKTKDFQNIFDYVFMPVFIDSGHTSSLGNKIIAKNVLNILEEILTDNYKQTTIRENIFYSEYKSGKKFDGIFGVDVDFSEKNFKNMNLRNSIFDKSDFMGANLSGADLTKSRLFSTNLKNAELFDTDLTNANLSYANLSGVDLTNSDLTETILVGANLSDTKLGNFDFKGRDLTQIKLDYQNLSDMDLSYSLMEGSSFIESDLSNVNFSEASLVNIDFTKVKNKELKNVNFTFSQLSHSDLSSVDLDQVIFQETNLQKTRLINTDFSNIKEKKLYGSWFNESILKNSNFSGISFFDQKIHEITISDFEQSTDNLMKLSSEIFRDNLMNKEIVQTTSDGNNLVVSYIFFTDFRSADLENSNFSNSDLSFVLFNNADLSGADLSGANLYGVDFTDADLSGANLSGANLDYATLNCINHQICN